MSPLRKGGQSAVSYNIKELTAANKQKPRGKKRSRAQIVAIGINAARRNKR